MALSDRLGLESYDEELGEARRADGSDGTAADAACCRRSSRSGLRRTCRAIGHPIQFVDVQPKTADGRAHLFPDDLPSRAGSVRLRIRPGDERASAHADFAGQRAHDLFHTWRASARRSRNLKIAPGRFASAQYRRWRPVRIFNALGEVHCSAKVTPEVPAGHGVPAQGPVGEEHVQRRHGQRARPGLPDGYRRRRVLQRRARAGRAARPALTQ